METTTVVMDHPALLVEKTLETSLERQSELSPLFGACACS
jgi:hypothetical protein